MRRRQCLLWLAALASAGIMPARARGSEDLVFLVHPYDTPSRLYSRFRPLTRYLAGLLGRPVRLIIAATYDEAIDMIASGLADFAYLGPTPYVQARERGDLALLLGETERGQAFYQSALVVRADSPIQRVQDLAGKRVALGAEISMSSAVAPQLILAQAGLKRSELAEISHLDRHERVALAVLHGDFDAGGLRLDIARAYLSRGLRILAVSQPLPPHVLVASSKVSPEQAMKVRQALLQPDAACMDAIRSLSPHAGFVAVEDSHFHGVRRMLRALESW